MHSRYRAALASACAVLVPLATAGAANAATPIDPGPSTSLPAFVGKPATPKPINGVPRTAQNPYMAPNDVSSTHDDAWQTDTVRRSGPLGKKLVMQSNTSPAPVGDCVSQSFDKKGRLISVCATPAVPGPMLKMFDPKTLDQLASTPLPDRPAPLSGIPTLKDTSGGVYFYLDNKYRAVVAAPNNHIMRFREQGNSFVLDHDYDVASHLNQQYPAGDAPQQRIVSALPDWNGLIWFVTRMDGVVGTLNPKTGAVKTIQLGHGLENSIENSFAVDKKGVYVATNRRMLALHAGKDGTPVVTWSKTYKNSGQFKPGQFDDGTGTTPTVLPGGYVAITDNADPMDVVAYSTRDGRQVCDQPVFGVGASATENSLIGIGRSLIVENNYGYDVFGFQTGAVQSTGGVARIDINPGGKRCHIVWTSQEIVPSVISKASIASGLIHSYTREVDPNGVQAWYWTAIDYRTGKTQYKQLAGTGPQWNNHYAALTIGPDGTEYTSGFPGGLWSLRDGS
jgi:hypothetical protein